MQARYYDPVIGRFLSVDPQNYLTTDDTRFFNRYTYCYNNPISCTDSDGEFGLVGAAFGAVIGAVAGAIVNGGAEFLAQSGNGGEVNLKAVFAKAAMTTGALLGATNIKVAPTNGLGVAEGVNAVANQALDAVTPRIAETVADAFSEVSDAFGAAASLPNIEPAPDCGTDGTIC